VTALHFVLYGHTNVLTVCTQKRHALVWLDLYGVWEMHGRGHQFTNG
jgi:hypothetical protein